MEQTEQKIQIDDARKALKELGNIRLPGSEDIKTELYRYGGEILTHIITKIFQNNEIEEQMPLESYTSFISSTFKKGNKKKCGKYKGGHIVYYYIEISNKK